MFDFLKRPRSQSRSRSPLRKSVRDSGQGDIFSKGRHVSRTKLRKEIKKSVSDIPGGRKWFHQQGKEKGVASALFAEKEYGSFVSRKDFDKRLRVLREERQHAKTFADRKNVIKKMELLKRLRGS